MSAKPFTSQSAVSPMPINTAATKGPSTLFRFGSQREKNVTMPLNNTVPQTATNVLYSLATPINNINLNTANNVFGVPATGTPSTNAISNITNNIFGVPAAATPFTNAVPNTTTNLFRAPATGTPFTNAIPNTATNLFRAPATATPANNSTSNTPYNVFGTPTTGTPFNNTTPNTVANIFGAPATTITTPYDITPNNTTANIFSMPMSTVPTQVQNGDQLMSLNTQQYLTAALLDPYGNQGRKYFSHLNQIQVCTESAPTSTSLGVVCKTSMPVTLPVQTCSRKSLSSRSVIDVNFKLKPVSSLPISLNDTIVPIIQQSAASSPRQTITALKANFTDEEELTLLSQSKTSKMHISKDMIVPMHESSSIRSLYALRSLDELENIISTRPLSSTYQETVSVFNQRMPHSANIARDTAPDNQAASSTLYKKSPRAQEGLNNDSEHVRLPILNRDNYYMKPTTSELGSLFNDKGECILPWFTVGHEKFGSVTFYGQINVAGLNLDEIVEINHQEVIVYPNDTDKPPVGKELNQSARITLLNVYPIDRATREEITDKERIKAMKYCDYLLDVTKKFDGEFINYEIQDGSWTFMVKHFTWYGLDDNQNDLSTQSSILNLKDTM